jgi:hypothetical protein
MHLLFEIREHLRIQLDCRQMNNVPLAAFIIHDSFVPAQPADRSVELPDYDSLFVCLGIGMQFVVV